MGMILAKIFLLQIIVAAIVIFILKKVLDRQLQQLAVKKLDYLKLDKDDLASETIILSAPGPVSLATQEAVARLSQKKFGRSVKIVTRADPSLRGGLVIKLKRTIIDFSLVGRLKEGGILRSK